MIVKRDDFGEQKTSTQEISFQDLRSFAHYGQTATGKAVSDRKAYLETVKCFEHDTNEVTVLPI
jgi:hypothetical protein